MLCDIKDIFKHCEMCKKHTSTPISSKLVIPYDDGEPYKQWAIDGIGPMPTNSKDKKINLQESTSVLAGPLPKKCPNTMEILLEDSLDRRSLGRLDLLVKY